MCLYTRFFGTVPPASCIFLALGLFESAGVLVSMILFASDVCLSGCALSEYSQVLSFICGQFTIENDVQGRLCVFIHAEDAQ